MRHAKKGDLAISTNAIVILIIAVIMLGLIIGFITKAFSNISGTFEEKFKNVESPPTATASRPVSVVQSITGEPGDDVRLKISVYNTLAAATSDIAPDLSCPLGILDGTAGSEQVNVESIPARKSNEFLYLAKIDKSATAGEKLCQVKIDVTDGSTTESYAEDIIVTVRG